MRITCTAALFDSMFSVVLVLCGSAAWQPSLDFGARAQPWRGATWASRSRCAVAMAKKAKFGIFSPLVLGAKAMIGKDELLKLRGKVITEHSKVIARFVDTSESRFGQIALSRLFAAADSDDSGTLDKREVEAALLALGYARAQPPPPTSPPPQP